MLLEGHKVASTSTEAGLTSLCNRQDILRPITPTNDVARHCKTGLMVQNDEVNSNKLEA